MCFCSPREKLAVARLQREVAQRRSEGAMVSAGWSLLLLHLPSKGLWLERHFVSLGYLRKIFACSKLNDVLVNKVFLMQFGQFYHLQTGAGGGRGGIN